jgi:hypothetical protein
MHEEAHSQAQVGTVGSRASEAGDILRRYLGQLATLKIKSQSRSGYRVVVLPAAQHRLCDCAGAVADIPIAAAISPQAQITEPLSFRLPA